MKYLKLFEDHLNIDVEDIKDILLPLSDDYNLKFKDAKIGESIRMESEYRTASDILHYKDFERYNSYIIHLSGKIKYEKEFFKELKYVVEQIESYAGLKLHCIYISSFKHEYFKDIDTLEFLKMKHNKNGLKMHTDFMLMFEM